MQFVVMRNEPIEKSLLPELEIPKGSVADGVIFLDQDMKVINLPSRWLTKMAVNRRLSSESIPTYARNTIYFLKYISSKMSSLLTYDEMILSVRLSMLENWIRYQTDDLGLEASTVLNREMTVRNLYEFLSNAQEGIQVIDKSPFPEYQLSKNPKIKAVKAVSISDVKNLMLQTPYERERLLLQFVFDSGVRISEIPRVTFGDIQDAINFANSQFVNDERGSLSVGYAPLVIHGSKGRRNSIKERVTVVTEVTLLRIKSYHSSPLYRRYLKRYQDPRKAPWIFNTNGDAYTKQSISKLFARLSERAMRRGVIDENAHPHRFRHGNAYLTLQDIDRGNDFLERLVFVQKSFGHANASTTERYTSIPHDIYDSLVNADGVVLGRTEKMKQLVEHTKLKIKLGDTA